MALRRWHWQIDELEAGPDYVLRMEFAPADAPMLHALVRDHLPSQYVQNDVTPRPRRYESATSYAGYVDKNTYELMQAKHPHIWLYGEIEVIDHRMMVRHVLAGGMYDETALVVTLARCPSLTLTSWLVAFAGYEWGVVASGSTAAGLLEDLEA